MRARQYDPGNGRFLSRDTWPLDHANPVELNRYVYAAGNPVMFSDPSGYFIEISNIIRSVKTFGVQSLRATQRFVVTNYLNFLFQLSESPFWVRWIVYYLTGVETPFKTSISRPNGVANKRLNNIIDDMYRPGSQVGPNGSLQDAIRAERATGLPVGGRFHTEKGRNMLNALRNWIGDVTFPKRGKAPEIATNDDLKVAIELFTDLYDALYGPYHSGPPMR